jgi:anti-sigma B factor antagonist
MVPQPRPADHDHTTAAGHLSIRVRRSRPRTVLVRVAGEVDLHTAPGLDEALDSHIGEQTGEVVVDLSEVTFFSVAGLTSLLRAQLLADAAGTHLVVDAEGSRAARRLFELLPVAFDGVSPTHRVRDRSA